MKGKLIGGAALVLLLLAMRGSASASSKAPAGALALPQYDSIDADMQVKMYHMLGAFESKRNHGLWYVSSREKSFGYIQSNLYSSDAPQIEMAKMYAAMGGTHSKELSKYQTTADALADFDNYKALMSAAAADPKMHLAQQKFFFEYFLIDAFNTASAAGVTLAIGYYTLADDLIVNGNKSYNKERFLRFMENGDGDEASKIRAFMDDKLGRLKNSFAGLSEPGKSYSTTLRMQYQYDLLANNPHLRGTVMVQSGQSRVAIG